MMKKGKSKKTKKGVRIRANEHSFIVNNKNRSKNYAEIDDDAPVIDKEQKHEFE